MSRMKLGECFAMIMREVEAIVLPTGIAPGATLHRGIRQGSLQRSAIRANCLGLPNSDLPALLTIRFAWP